MISDKCVEKHIEITQNALISPSILACVCLRTEKRKQNRMNKSVPRKKSETPTLNLCSSKDGT